MKKLTIIRRQLEICDQIIHISEQRVLSEVKKVIYHDKVDRIQNVYVPSKRASKFTKEKQIKLHINCWLYLKEMSLLGDLFSNDN